MKSPRPVSSPGPLQQQSVHRSSPIAGYPELLRTFEAFARYDHSVSIPQLGSIFRWEADSPLGRDQAQLATVFEVPFAWPATNGTTSLNVLALVTLLKPGDRVLCQRDAHVSVLAGILHAGAIPAYLVPRYHDSLGMSLSITPDAIERDLICHPDTAAVVLTYPSYFGVAGDLVGCVAVARAHSVPVVVDAAHGTYFRFHPALPPSADSSGAAMVTHSAHKTCAALSQGSLLLVNDARVVERFYEVVNLTGCISTSFSYPILQSVMLAVHQLVTQGELLLGRAIEMSQTVRTHLNAVAGLSCVGEDAFAEEGLALDPLRLTIDVSGLGITGFAAEQWLIDHAHLYAEMATLNHVLLLLTPADDQDSGERIVRAMTRLAHAHRGRSPLHLDIVPPALPPQRYAPRTVFYTGQRRRVPVREALGQVSAETIATYPPGSAVIVAGEIVTEDVLEFLTAMHTHGGVLKGAGDATFRTMTVLDPDLEL